MEGKHNIHFAEIAEDDLHIVKEIYDWYILNSTATFHISPITIAEIKEFIYFRHPFYIAYLMYSGNEVAGYCLITNYKKRPAYDRSAEVTVYLKQEFCGRGIGRLSLDYLEKKAGERGIKNLIGVITGENQNSIALFEKSGYSKCAHFRNIGEKFGRVLDVVAYQKEI